MAGLDGTADAAAAGDPAAPATTAEGPASARPTTDTAEGER